MRPEVGTQAQFKKKKPPKTYRYDSSLSPALDWDAKNPAREQGETFIKQVLDAKSLEEAKAAASKLKGLSKPFLNWAVSNRFYETDGEPIMQRCRLWRNDRTEFRWNRKRLC
jgi:hypothetical protein